MIHRYLDNGLEVYIHPVDFSPVVAMQLVVNVGSQDEHDNEGGMAHVLEHMLFKGSRHFPAVGRLALTVEEAGGDINAYTTFDHTNYHITAPKAFVKQGLDLLFDMIFFTQLETQELTKELEVILEEIRRGRDSPSSRLSQNAFSHFYKETPLQRPVIGYESVVSQFNRQQVWDFYSRWYVPNNCLLVVVGDFCEQAVWEQLQVWSSQIPSRSIPERLFGSVVQRNGKQHPLALVAQQTTPGVDLEFGEWQEARVHLSLAAPALEDFDAPLWDVTAAVLGDGAASRLVRVVKEEQQLATSISCGVFFPHVPYGMFSVSFYGVADNTPKVLRSVKEELTRLANDLPSASELERVINQMRANRFYTQESMDGLARHAQFSLATSAKMNFEPQYLARMEKVTTAQVQSLAQHLLQQLQSGHFLLTGIFTDKIKPRAEAEHWQQSLTKILCEPDYEIHTQDSPLEHTSSAPQTGAYNRVSSAHNSQVQQIVLPLPQGRTLHVNFKLCDRLPLFSGLFSTHSGLIHENPNHKSSAYLCAQMLTRGTVKQNYNDFTQELEHKVCQLGASVSKDFFTLKWEGLSEHGSRLCEMALDALLQPAFAEEEFRKLVTETQEVMTASLDSPSFRLSRLLGPLLFPEHPYGRLLMGDELSLKNLTLDHVEDFWEGIFSQQNFILSLAGHVRDLDLWVNRWHSGLSQLIESLSQPVAEPYPKQFMKPNPSENRLAYDVLNREQVHLVVAWQGVPIDDEERLSLEVAVQILAGQGGRLFLDLRDEKSLAYSVQAYQAINKLAGTFQTYMAAAPQKIQEAIAGLKHHVQTLASSAPPSEGEVARAKSTLLGSMAIDSQYYSYQASQLASSDLYGFSFDHFLLFEQRLAKVTTETVRLAVANMLNRGAPFMAFVGPVPEDMQLNKSPS